MACTVSFESRNKILGPVDATNAMRVLATMLMKTYPDWFCDLTEAERYLTKVHFLNMTEKRNGAGVDYPNYI